MRKLKIDEERPVFLRARHILFPEIIRPVISCRRHQDCIARPILLGHEISRETTLIETEKKTPKFHLLLFTLINWIFHHDPT